MNKQQIELGLKIRALIGEDDIEDALYNYVMDGHKYNLQEVQNSGWDDEGKYQNRYLVYEIVEDDVETGIYLGQSCMRSGSYYTDYHYEYERPELVKKEEKIIKVINYAPLKNK